MKRSQKEIDVMVARLHVGKEMLPKTNFFGDDNHKAIDLQIDVLLDKISEEDELHDMFDEGDITESELSSGIDAFSWLSGDSDELADEEWVVSKKKLRKKPCKECPFRKASLPGYLGESSHDPQSFLQSTKGSPIPCHLEVNWEKEDPKSVIEKGFSNPCIGSLKFLKNTATLPREKKYGEMLGNVEKDESVFSSTKEFINHHS